MNRSQLVSRFKTEFLSQIVVAISGTLLAIVLARLLNPDDYGLLFLAISILGVGKLFAKLGIGKSAARFVSEYKEKDPSQIRHILRISLLFNMVTISIVSIVMVVYYRQFAEILGNSNLAPFLLLGILYLIFETLAKYIRYVLQGFEAIEAAAMIHAIDRCSQLIFAIGFVVLGYGALGALAGYIIASFGAVLIGFGLIYRRYYRGWEQGAVEEGLQLRLVQYTVPLTATSTADVLDKQIDTVLVGFFLSPTSVAYYVVSKQIIKFVEKPVEALGFTLSPTYGAKKASGNIKHAAHIYETALVHSLLLYIPAAAGLILVSEPLITLVFGGSYLGAIPVLQILGLYAVLQSVTKITSNGLDFLGRARDRAIVKGVTSVLNVVFTVSLLPVIGLIGAPVATVITYSIYTIANVCIAHSEFDLRVKYLTKNISMIVFVTGIMSIVVFGLIQSVEGWLSLTLGVSIGVSIWALLSLQFGLLDIRDVRSMLA